MTRATAPQRTWSVPGDPRSHAVNLKSHNLTAALEPYIAGQAEVCFGACLAPTEALSAATK